MKVIKTPGKRRQFKISNDKDIIKLETPPKVKDIKVTKTLILKIYPTGSKKWYKYGGRGRTQKIGDFPQMGLEEAKYLTSDIAVILNTNKTFRNLIPEFIQFQILKGLHQKTIEKKKKQLNKYVLNNPKIVDKNVKTIKIQHIIEITNSIIASGFNSTAEQIFNLFQEFIKWARLMGYCSVSTYVEITSQTFSSIYGKRINTKAGFAWLTDEVDLKILIKHINQYESVINTKIGMILQLLLALRSTNLINLRWDHIDFEKRELFISKYEMKTEQQDLHIGLPDQVIELLKKHRSKKIRMSSKMEYVVEGNNGSKISNGTINKALKGIPFLNLPKNEVTKKQYEHITSHSFRKIFSTFYRKNQAEHELPYFLRDEIMNHAKGQVEGTYDKGSNVEGTRKALKWWCEYLISLGLELNYE